MRFSHDFLTTIDYQKPEKVAQSEIKQQNSPFSETQKKLRNTLFIRLFEALPMVVPGRIELPTHGFSVFKEVHIYAVFNHFDDHLITNNRLKSGHSRQTLTGIEQGYS